MAAPSSILAWRIPVTEEPGGLQSMGLQSQTRRSDWTHTHTYTYTHHYEHPCGSSWPLYSICLLCSQTSATQTPFGTSSVHTASSSLCGYHGLWERPYGPQWQLMKCLPTVFCSSVYEWARNPGLVNGLRAVPYGKASLFLKTTLKCITPYFC